MFMTGIRLQNFLLGPLPLDYITLLHSSLPDTPPHASFRRSISTFCRRRNRLLRLSSVFSFIYLQASLFLQ